MILVSNMILLALNINSVWYMEKFTFIISYSRFNVLIIFNGYYE